MNKGYTTYFKLQSALSDLIDAELIREESAHNRTLYHLTSEGNESIVYFKNKIAKEIRDDIDSYLKEHKLELKDETSVKADYYKSTSGEYIVTCQALENQNPLISLTLSVSSEKEAEHIAATWQKKSQTVYAWLMTQLLD